jgi:hypothetical protein
LEKQLALLIDSAVPGMSFEIYKTFNLQGVVQKIEHSDSLESYQTCCLQFDN